MNDEQSTPEQAAAYESKEREYSLVEMYNSVKGEGTQAGIPMTFVRFSKCNLACAWCDTPYDRVAIRLKWYLLLQAIADQKPVWVVWTGGEPMLQLSERLTKAVHTVGIKQAIETNGMLWNTGALNLNYINISPKLGEAVDHKWLQQPIDEVRYTLCDGQDDIWNVFGEAHSDVDPTGLHPKAITLSPMMQDPNVGMSTFVSGKGFPSLHGEVNQASLNRCLALVDKYRHLGARLSVQVHKFIAVR